MSVFSHLLRLLNLKRAKPLDYSADEIADAGDVYLAGMARGAAKAASAGGETLAAKVAGRGAISLSHDGDR